MVGNERSCDTGGQANSTRLYHVRHQGSNFRVQLCQLSAWVVLPLAVVQQLAQAEQRLAVQEDLGDDAAQGKYVLQWRA